MTEEAKPTSASGVPETPPPRAGIMELIQGVRSGKIDPLTALLYLSELRRMDRDEDRWNMERELRKNPQPQITPETIATAVTTALEKTLPQIIPQTSSIPPTTAPQEMPKWAEEMQRQQQEILARLSKEEQEKERQKIIEESQRPVLAELEKERAERQRLQEDMKKMEERLKTSPSIPPKGELEQFLDTREKLKSSGLIQETPPGSVVLGEGGIPITGSVPALAVYAPKIVDDILTNIEKRIDKMVAKYGLFQPAEEKREEIIKLPEKPEVKPFPPLKPAPPKEKAAPPTPPPPVTPPAEELIKIPEKPTEIPTPEVKPAPEVVKPPEAPAEEKLVEKPTEEAPAKPPEEKPAEKPPEEVKPAEKPVETSKEEKPEEAPPKKTRKGEKRGKEPEPENKPTGN
ncbi:MAG: hypothetical protein QXI87_09490 [Thermoproteota archaeon]